MRRRSLALSCGLLLGCTPGPVPSREPPDSADDSVRAAFVGSAAALSSQPATPPLTESDARRVLVTFARAGRPFGELLSSAEPLRFSTTTIEDGCLRLGGGWSVNLEQRTFGWSWVRPPFMRALSGHLVWDDSTEDWLVEVEEALSSCWLRRL